MTLIRRFPSNNRGRDFVVGDLHGCLGLLQTLLNKAGFNPATDRVFSTGDLVDRGPDTPGCLALLEEPWFHAVMGNHEDMLVDYLDSLEQCQDEATLARSQERLLWNGGQWILDQLASCLEYQPGLHTALRSLPYVISVGEPGDPDRFHVLHGDLFADSDIMIRDSELDALGTAGHEHPMASMLKTSLWSRQLMEETGMYRDTPMLEGLSRTYVGHTIVRKPRLVASHCFIDGGGFLCEYRGHSAEHYHLNLIDHSRGMHYWTNGQEVHEDRLLLKEERPPV